MARPYFYYGTTRSYVIAFATILNGLSFKDGWGNLREVPVHYAPRQKWLEDIQQNTDLDQMDVDMTLPRIAFEFMSMTYDPTRMTNALNKIDNVSATDPTTQKTFILNRQSYNFNVKVYVAAVRFNDLLQILEQIIPFFTPSLTVTLNDTNGLGFTTNIPINLNSIDYNIDYEGSFDNRRVISATLDFTLKGYQYSNPHVQSRILQAIINLTAVDFDFKMTALENGNFTINPETTETMITVNESTLRAMAGDLNTDIVPQGQNNLYNPEVTAIASVALASPLIVAVKNGQAYLPDLTNPVDVNNLAGVTMSPVPAGATVRISKLATFTQPNWNWTPGRLFVSTTGGNLTQIVPTAGAIVEAGNAVTATEVLIDLQPASYFI